MRGWVPSAGDGSSRAVCHQSVAPMCTYHVSVFEIINLFRYTFNFCGKFAGLRVMVTAGNIMLKWTFLGPVVFHIMACVARYSVVVYPVTPLRLRQSAGIRIRFISTVCV